ncbi:MAG: hypothetical protein J4N94_06820, partial [Chloroflexi bacterium]|nr:hypothetical protein [Chloroflexota bacterium]
NGDANCFANTIAYTVTCFGAVSLTRDNANGHCNELQHTAADSDLHAITNTVRIAYAVSNAKANAHSPCRRRTCSRGHRYSRVGGGDSSRPSGNGGGPKR